MMAFWLFPDFEPTPYHPKVLLFLPADSVGTIVKKRSVPIVRDLGDLGFSADVGPMLGTSLSAQESPK